MTVNVCDVQKDTHSYRVLIYEGKYSTACTTPSNTFTGLHSKNQWWTCDGEIWGESTNG